MEAPAEHTVLMDLHESTSTSTLSQTVSSTPTKIASYSNARSRASEPVDGGAHSSSPSKPPRPMSIIDDALFNSVSSTTSLFDKRRSLTFVADTTSLIPRPSSPNTRAISFRTATETIAEDTNANWDVSHEPPDLFSGKDSPTRTRSRIPISSVGHALALVEETGPFDSPLSSRHDGTGGHIPSRQESRYSLPSPNVSSPRVLSNLRPMSSVVAGGTTKVLSDLQAGVEHAKKALENTKSQLRASQRTVAVLTRQTEDLKEGRDRLRLENEGLNNVVARKERLLQEVLDRARKAEGEASMLKTALKNTTSENKKTLSDMEATVSEATATSQKAECEYAALKDSVSGMMDAWRREVQQLRAQVLQKEEEWAKEREEVALKYKSVLKLQQAAHTERLRQEALKADKAESDAQFEDYFRRELSDLRDQFLSNAQRNNKAEITADYVASELSRIRHLMRHGDSGRLGEGSAL